MINEKIVKNRIAYLDWLEVFAIFLICFIHYPTLKTNWINNYADIVALGGVITFLFVNGALLLNKELNIKKHLNKCIKQPEE